MPPPTNGQTTPPHFRAGSSPQRPYFAGPEQQNSQPMPGHGQLPPSSMNTNFIRAPIRGPPPVGGPPPSGPVASSQMNQNFGGPHSSNASQNFYQGGVNAQPIARRPPGGPYGLSNQGMVGPPPPGVSSNQMGLSPGGQQRLAGPPPPGPSTPTSGSLPGGRLPPPPVGVKPPPSTSYSGQGGGDFHAGSSGNTLLSHSNRCHLHGSNLVYSICSDRLF